MANQDVLASAGSWVLTQGTQAGWLALRGLASNFIEQPWYESARALAGTSGPACRRHRRGDAGLPERRLRAPPPAGSADPAGGPCGLGGRRGRGAAARMAVARGAVRAASLLLVAASRRGARRAAIGADRCRGGRAGQELLGPRRQPAGRRPATRPAPRGHSRRARRHRSGRLERPVPPQSRSRAKPQDRPRIQGRRHPDHGARRDRAPGQLQRRLGRIGRGQSARGPGRRRRLRPPARQPGDGGRRRHRASGRPGVGRHPGPRRRRARHGRRDRRGEPRAPVHHHLRARRQAASTVAQPSALATVGRRLAGVFGRVPHARGARLRPRDVRPAEPRSGVRHRRPFLRPRLRDRAARPDPRSPHLRHADRGADPQRGRHSAASRSPSRSMPCSWWSRRWEGFSRSRTPWARPTPGAGWRWAP